MSDALSAIRSRRSVRRFGPGAIADEDVLLLKEAMLRAPSSRGIRPWRFVFVRDEGLLRTLAEAKPKWAEFVADAALAVVCCGDESASDAWIEDCSIAATNLMLAARDLGIGSCWVQIRGRERADGSSSEAWVREVVELTDAWRVECVIALGYPSEEKAPPETDRLRWDAVEER